MAPAASRRGGRSTPRARARGLDGGALDRGRSRPVAKDPRYHLANFPGTLTDSPGVGFMMKLWRRLNRAPLVASVVMTDLFSNVPLAAMLCAGTARRSSTPSTPTSRSSTASTSSRPAPRSSREPPRDSRTRASPPPPSFQRQLQSRGIRWCDRHYRPLPVDAIVLADALSTEDVAATRDELTAGHPNRPVMAYVGRWSAEKRIHLLKSCRPRGDDARHRRGRADAPGRGRVVARSPRVVVLTGMRTRARSSRGCTERRIGWRPRARSRRSGTCRTRRRTAAPRVASRRARV